MSKTKLEIGVPSTALAGAQKLEIAGLAGTSSIAKPLMIIGGVLGAATLAKLYMDSQSKPTSLNGPDLKAEILKNTVPKVAIAAVVLGGGYFLILRPIFQKIGLIETKADRQRAEQEKELGIGASSPFNPNFYKSAPAGAPLVTRATAESLARQMYDAIGTLTDDENAIYGALRTLKAKTQLSFVADVFAQKYNADLYQYLRRNLDDDEMDVVNNIANSLSGISDGLSGHLRF